MQRNYLSLHSKIIIFNLAHKGGQNSKFMDYHGERSLLRLQGLCLGFGEKVIRFVWESGIFKNWKVKPFSGEAIDSLWLRLQTSLFSLLICAFSSSHLFSSFVLIIIVSRFWRILCSASSLYRQYSVKISRSEGYRFSSSSKAIFSSLRLSRYFLKRNSRWSGHCSLSTCRALILIGFSSSLRLSLKSLAIELSKLLISLKKCLTLRCRDSISGAWQPLVLGAVFFLGQQVYCSAVSSCSFFFRKVFSRFKCFIYSCNSSYFSISLPQSQESLLESTYASGMDFTLARTGSLGGRDFLTASALPRDTGLMNCYWLRSELAVVMGVLR